MTRALIRVLLALHPREWRAEYGPEYRALLDDTPISPSLLVDVARNALRLQLRARPTLARLAAALAISAIAEVIAVRGNLSDNILWIPSSALKAVLLAAVVLPWLLPLGAYGRTARRGRPRGRAGTGDG